MLTGVVIIVKLNINSGTGETPGELIPRLTAVYGSRNLGFEHGLFLLLYDSRVDTGLNRPFGETTAAQGGLIDPGTRLLSILFEQEPQG